jgi:hypothetical protein
VSVPLLVKHMLLQKVNISLAMLLIYRLDMDGFVFVKVKHLNLSRRAPPLQKLLPLYFYCCEHVNFLMSRACLGKIQIDTWDWVPGWHECAH